PETCVEPTTAPENAEGACSTSGALVAASRSPDAQMSFAPDASTDHSSPEPDAVRHLGPLLPVVVEDRPGRVPRPDVVRGHRGDPVADVEEVRRVPPVRAVPVMEVAAEAHLSLTARRDRLAQ